MKIVVIGAAGLLGRARCRAFSSDWSVIAVTHADVDICDLRHTKALIGYARPDVVINAAAYADVDGCESDPERAFNVNAFGARNVAIASRAVRASHVYVSTDYVESDPPAPLNVYGWSKLAGERAVQRSHPRSFIVRTSWLYGDGRDNFVHAILTAAQARQDLAVASDQRGTPTWVDDLAHQIRTLVLCEAFGLYYASSEGSCTRYAFALEIPRRAGYAEHPADNRATRFTSKSDPTNTFVVRPTRSEELNRPARRPRCAVLQSVWARTSCRKNSFPKQSAASCAGNPSQSMAAERRDETGCTSRMHASDWNECSARGELGRSTTSPESVNVETSISSMRCVVLSMK